MNGIRISVRWLRLILWPNYSIDSQESCFMEFNLAMVYLVGGPLRMEMRKPIGIPYYCNFLNDAKSSNFLDSLCKAQSPQKNISLLWKLSNLLESAVQLHQILKLELLCLATRTSATDNEGPNKDSENGINKTHERLSYWVTSSQKGLCVQIKNCILELFKTSMQNYLPKTWIKLRHNSKTTGKYIKKDKH